MSVNVGGRTPALCLSLCLWAVSGIVPCFSAPLEWTFSLVPSADVVGPAGSTVGWGYTIENLDPDFWLVPLFLDADLFQNGTPLSLFDFPILAPGQSVTLAFSAILAQGLYQLQWDPGAPLNFVNAGRFTLTADFYSADPLNGGFNLFLESQRDADYTAQVGDTAEVPEPAAAWLIAPALAALAGLRRRRFSRRAPSPANGD